MHSPGVAQDNLVCGISGSGVSGQLVRAFVLSRFSSHETGGPAPPSSHFFLRIRIILENTCLPWFYLATLTDSPSPRLAPHRSHLHELQQRVLCLWLLLITGPPLKKLLLPRSGEHSARGFAANGLRFLRHQVRDVYSRDFFNTLSPSCFSPEKGSEVHSATPFPTSPTLFPNESDLALSRLVVPANFTTLPRL